MLIEACAEPPIDYWTVTTSLSFFFQAEDGIRDFHVTGVQTCALPISPCPASTWRSTQLYATLRRPSANHLANGGLDQSSVSVGSFSQASLRACSAQNRSEERRVGKDRSTRTDRHDENIQATQHTYQCA